MKTAFRISILANLALAALLPWLARRPRLESGALPVPAAMAGATAAPEARSSSSPAQNAGRDQAEPFRWSRLESTDYRVYIANLRDIGCPEQTIRDIIKADVDNLYASRREELARKIAARSGGSFTADLVARQELESGLQQLSHEEASVISSLLGPDASLMQTAAAHPSPPRSLRNNSGNDVVSMPLVLQNVDPALMKIDSRQAGVISDLRQEFEREIGGPSQDPNNPAYRQRWLTAQRNSDDMVRGMLGRQFYIDYQLQAVDPRSQPQ